MDTSDLGAKWFEQLRVKVQVSGANPSTAQRVDFRTGCGAFLGFLKILLFFNLILEFLKILITTDW